MGVKNYLAKAYVIAVCLILPFYMENGYFNTLDAKAHAFWIISGVVLILGAIWGVVEAFMGKAEDDDYFSISLMDFFVAAFAAVSLVSCIFSEYRTSAFTGEMGWNMGAYTLCALALTYYYISRNYKMESQIWVYFTSAASIMFVLGFLNGIGLDPLGVHMRLSESEMFEYIATIGNINSYSGYLSMLIPLLSFVFIADGRKWLKIWLFPVLILGMGNLIANNSDGAFLGAGLGILFMIYYCLKDPGKIGGLSLVGLMYAAGMALMDLVSGTNPLEMVEYSGISGLVTRFYVYIPLVVFCAVIFFLSRQTQVFNEKSCKVISRLFATIVILGIICGVIYTALHWSGKWGTKRGWIWEFAISLFASGSIREKLIGVGPEMFGTPVMDTFGDFISKHWGKRIANAHNEFLQYLVTMGIFGLTAYAGIYFSSFRKYVRRKKEEWTWEEGALFFAIMGYMGQALVNNPQALNYATLFMILAIYRGVDVRRRAAEMIGREDELSDMDLSEDSAMEGDFETDFETDFDKTPEAAGDGR